MARQIDYYFATISPFTYLAGDRLERIAAATGAEIAYKPVDLARIFAATGGVALGERPVQRREYRLQELRRGAAKAGMPINLQPAFFPTNAMPSAYAVIAAGKARSGARGGSGSGDTGLLVQLLLAACWAEERNIAEDEVICDCLEKAGFDRGLSMAGLLTGAEQLMKNTDAAIEAGVFGAPFYIVDGTERFWGHDRLDDLQAHLEGRL